jgi:hypothetical protein
LITDKPDIAVEWLTVLFHILELPDSNLTQRLAIQSHIFLSLAGKCHDNSSISLWPLFSTSFPTHYSLILSFNAMERIINKQWISKWIRLYEDDFSFHHHIQNSSGGLRRFNTYHMFLLIRSNHLSDLNQNINLSLSDFHHFPQILPRQMTVPLNLPFITISFSTMYIFIYLFCNTVIS